MEATSTDSIPIEKPSQVRNAVRLLLASLAVGILRTAIGVPSGAGSIVTFVVLVATITIAIVGFLVIKISGGRNWARIAYVVLFLLGLPYSIIVLAQEFAANALVGLVSVIQILLQSIAIVLLFRRASNAWFRSGRGVRPNTVSQ